MSKSPLLPVRGFRAGLISDDKRVISALVRQLDLLGLIIVPPCRPLDVCFVDIDGIMDDPEAFAEPKAPLIAVVGTETPGRLEWMLRLEPSAVLMKPIGSHGVYTALAVAFHDRGRRQREMQRVKKLEDRIKSRRIVVAATIKLMQQYDIQEPEAFSLLRNAAQQRRMTIESLSAEVASNAFLPLRLAASN